MQSYATSFYFVLSTHTQREREREREKETLLCVCVFADCFIELWNLLHRLAIQRVDKTPWTELIAKNIIINNEKQQQQQMNDCSSLGSLLGVCVGRVRPNAMWGSCFWQREPPSFLYSSSSTFPCSSSSFLLPRLTCRVFCLFPHGGKRRRRRMFQRVQYSVYGVVSPPAVFSPFEKRDMTPSHTRTKKRNLLYSTKPYYSGEWESVRSNSRSRTQKQPSWRSHSRQRNHKQIGRKQNIFSPSSST